VVVDTVTSWFEFVPDVLAWSASKYREESTRGVKREVRQDDQAKASEHESVYHSI
jgi:hypothetical protein